MGLFSALSGKIYRFNSINQPIDNGIAAKIKGLEDTPECILGVDFPRLSFRNAFS